MDIVLSLTNLSISPQNPFKAILRKSPIFSSAFKIVLFLYNRNGDTQVRVFVFLLDRIKQLIKDNDIYQFNCRLNI